MKKRWLIPSAIIALLVLGIGGGTVMAQESEDEGDSPLTSFVARVAGILGLEEQVVQSAFDQAAQEVQEELLDRKLAHLVEQGIITPEQADEQREWYGARPDSLRSGFGSFGFKGHRGRWGGGWGHHGMFGRGSHGSMPPPPPPVDDSA